MHTAEARSAMAAAGLRALPNWPPTSPDLNPQEHVWGWSEPHVCKAEAKSDTFERFKQRVSEICLKYTGAAKLVSSLEHRVALCLRRKGHNIGK